MSAPFELLLNFLKLSVNLHLRVARLPTLVVNVSSIAW